MCGPLITRLPKHLYAYHLGRLFSYVAAGALAGWLGESLVPWRWLNLFATSLLAGFFLYSAVRLWQGKREVSLVPGALVRWVERPLGDLLARRTASVGAVFAVGILTALLPCGWLHTFIAAAVATGSVKSGGILLFVFWLGTVPALALGNSFLRRTLAPIGKRYPGIVSLFLIAAALGTIAFRFSPVIGSSADCH